MLGIMIDLKVNYVCFEMIIREIVDILELVVLSQK